MFLITTSPMRRRITQMKKKLLILTAVLVLLMFVLFVGSSSDEPLSPIAEKNLAFKLPDVAPADNAVIGLSGLGNPQDGDVVTAGKKYLETPPEFQSGSEEAPKFDFSYKNPCLVSDQGNCLDQIMADASTINAAF